MPPRLNIPPFTRALLVTFVASSILNTAVRIGKGDIFIVPFRKSDNDASYLVITNAAWRFPWVFITAAFVETNLFGVLITGSTLLYGGRYLERAWSSAELAKFISGVTVIPDVLSYAIFTLLSINSSICGGLALQAAFLVAFKQLVPEHTVSVARGWIRMRVKHLPALYLLVNAMSAVIFGTWTALLLSFFGFMTSWIYLRFYRVSQLLSSASTGETSSIRGDASDTFAFAHFFPEPLQSPVGVVANQVYEVLVLIRVCRPFSDEEVDAGNEQAIARSEGGLPSIMGSGGRSGGGGGRREEAERRRALALKALDQRLHAAAGKPEAHSTGGSTTVPNEPVVDSASNDHSEAGRS